MKSYDDDDQKMTFEELPARSPELLIPAAIK